MTRKFRNPIGFLVLFLTLAPSPGSSADHPRDNFSDTWVATDALGRSLPTAPQVGPPRPNKLVGIFYFLWLGRHGEAGPFDITKILAQDPDAMQKPDSPLWGPLHIPHHWGESIFGYYVADDDAVLRKHAQMLGDAGVDVVIFDVTNQLDYPESWRALGRVFAEARAQGGHVPQFAFLCPFWDPSRVVKTLYETLYQPGFHPELWFQWEGKPLILADPNLLGTALQQTAHDHPAELNAQTQLGQSFHTDQAFTAVAAHTPTWGTTNGAITLTLRQSGPSGEQLGQRRVTNIRDNDWLTLELSEPLPAGDYYLELSDAKGQVGWWSHRQDRFPAGQAFANGLAVAGDRAFRVQTLEGWEANARKFFTFRKPQPDYFVGPTGSNQWGWLEVHPQHGFYNASGTVEQVTVGVGQNALDGKLSVLSNPRAHGRSFHDGRQPGSEQQDFTGRNAAEQWERALSLDPPFIFVTGWNEWIAGRFKAPSGFYGDGPVTFVDQFNREYSRDIEPMRGGHGDAFYYQLIANIRRFKGARPLPTLDSRPIHVDGRFEDWQEVMPEYRDTIGDPVQRDYRGWGQGTRYTNRTGRNDLVAAKVSADGDYLAFYVRTREPLSPQTNPNWMLLFLDTDHNPTNGWMGYDYVFNRQPGVLERHDDKGYRWSAGRPVSWSSRGNELELKIPRRDLGMAESSPSLDFKWADNLQQTGDWSDFTVNGDAAPNDRYNYRAIFHSAMAHP